MRESNEALSKNCRSPHRPPNPFPDRRAGLIERDASPPEHGRDGTKRGSDGLSPWTHWNLEGRIVESRETRELPFRFHFEGEPPHVVAVGEGRQRFASPRMFFAASS
jgi:hypothetical protein